MASLKELCGLQDQLSRPPASSKRERKKPPGLEPAGKPESSQQAEAEAEAANTAPQVPTQGKAAAGTSDVVDSAAARFQSMLEAIVRGLEDRKARRHMSLKGFSLGGMQIKQM